jgi:hypothetical protein
LEVLRFCAAVLLHSLRVSHVETTAGSVTSHDLFSMFLLSQELPEAETLKMANTFSISCLGESESSDIEPANSISSSLLNFKGNFEKVQPYYQKSSTKASVLRKVSFLNKSELGYNQKDPPSQRKTTNNHY